MMIDLVPVDEAVLDGLLALAVNEARPDEVMPPASGESDTEVRTDWTEPRKGAFREYHRRCRISLHAPVTEVTWAVTAHGAIVGAARLAQVDGDPEAREVGLWLGESHRGRGISAEVAYWAFAAAQTMGAKRLVARSVGGAATSRAWLERIGFEVRGDGRDLIATAALP